MSKLVIDENVLDQIIEEIARDLGPGLLRRGPSEREIVLQLHSLCSTLVRRLPYMTAPQVERELELEFQRLIATGARGRDCNVLYRAASRLVNELARNGVGAVRVNEGMPTLLTRLRARARLARTISLPIVISIAVFFGLAILGLFAPAPPAAEWLVPIGEVLGFGWFGTASIPSVTLGLLLMAGLVADATGVIDKQVVIVRLAPLASAVGTLIGTVSLVGPAYAILFAIAALLWTRTLLMLQRFVVLSSAVDPLHVFAALSVLGYLATRDYTSADAALYFVAWLLIGIILCTSTLSVPIGRSERSPVGDRLLHHQVLSSMRMGLDPALGTGFVAFLVSVLLLPWLADRGGVVFFATQILCFFAAIWFRTRVRNVQRILARRQYAQVGDDGDLSRLLNRRLLLTLSWFALIAAGAIVLAETTDASPGMILLAEVAGFVLLIGWRELTGIVGGGQVDRTYGDDQVRKEQRAYTWGRFKALAKRPAGKIGIVVLVITVVWNLLTFLLDLWSMPQTLTEIWKWLTGAA